MRKYYVPNQPYIFISYAHKDVKVVMNYIKNLNELGCNIWFDTNIPVGEEWPEALMEHITGAKVVLVFVTQASADSKPVQREVHYAQKSNQVILPVLLEPGVEMSRLEFYMGDIQAVNLAGEKSVKAGREKIQRFLPKDVFLDCDLFDVEEKDESLQVYNRMPPDQLCLIEGEWRKGVKECKAIEGGFWQVCFEKNPTKPYQYRRDKIQILSEFEELDIQQYKIESERRLVPPLRLLKYSGNKGCVYYYLMYENSKYDKAISQDELRLIPSVLSRPSVNRIFDYMKEMAALSKLENQNNERLLEKRYRKINFVREDVALASYLKAYPVQDIQNNKYIPIYPFGCNESQVRAVENAFRKQISVIEGPPGTGKTQTILNIIANILMQNKNVMVVSNNNSATENVQEKLSAEKYCLDFLVAGLGNATNKSKFIENQRNTYPSVIQNWKSERKRQDLIAQVADVTRKVQKLFQEETTCAQCKQDLSALNLEARHFQMEDYGVSENAENMPIRGNKTSEDVLKFLFSCRNADIDKDRISFFEMIRGLLLGGFKSIHFLRKRRADILNILQMKYYMLRADELEQEIDQLTQSIKKNQHLKEELTSLSLEILKDEIYKRYARKESRIIFSSDELWKQGHEVVKEYPIILSTTFSSLTSLSDVTYDYVIMDEASQVDISTGAMALYCAENAVVVGDTKQLPNIVEDEAKAEEIFNRYKIDQGYEGTNSFLKSVKEVLPDIPIQLLREHYRCHPTIIDYCNTKFYNGSLVVMTEDHGEENVIEIFKTKKGQHARANYNQRQIDVVEVEILPKVTDESENIGIISPYRKQANALQSTFGEIECDTVHKFQGREKDTIILSTVDDYIKEFTDRADLLNVAISRAKNHLYVVVSGNIQSENTNIGDLISYASYRNCNICESNVRSVFDYLYKQYYADKEKYLEGHKRISQYDSENLVYVMILKVIQKHFTGLGVLFVYPLHQLLSDTDKLTVDERAYATNSASHIDFLIYSEVSKKVILAIEVDGTSFHVDGSKQKSRDILKDGILDKYGIPFLRFATNGSREEEKLIEKLDKLLHSYSV